MGQVLCSLEEGRVVNASELFKAGKLSEAIEAQLREVKSNPGDHSRRLFLFELLAFAGALDRAQRQIGAIEYGEMELDTAVTAYRKLLDAEKARRDLLAVGLAPQFLADPPEHVRLRLQAINCLRDNQPAEAREHLEKAAAASPIIKGQLNDKPFDSLRDCDDLFASLLEVVVNGVYHWVPLEDVESLECKPPRFPRDLLWFPGRLQLRSGSAGDVFLPALYPGSHEHPDDQVKLGRATDWKALPDGPVLGLGARLFLVGEDEISLLEWRQLKFG
jgi:type VI secretion system protein ImpE